MELQVGKSYSVYIPSEPTPDGCGMFLDETKLITVLEKDKESIVKQHFNHLLEDNWYCVKNLHTENKHWYYFQDNHVITEIKI